MRNVNTIFLVAVAGAALVFAGAMYYGFVRPVAPHTSSGTITSKVFEAARNLSKLQAGPRRELWTTTDRNLPEGYLFEIALENPAVRVQYILERTAAERFAVGQRVSVTFEEHGFPPFWSKRYVSRMTAIPE